MFLLIWSLTFRFINKKQKFSAFDIVESRSKEKKLFRYLACVEFCYNRFNWQNKQSTSFFYSTCWVMFRMTIKVYFFRVLVLKVYVSREKKNLHSLSHLSSKFRDYDKKMLTKQNVRNRSNDHSFCWKFYADYESS